MPDKHTHSELEILFQKADSVDKQTFSEMRSNVLLVAGEHYTRKSASFFRRVRNSRSLNREQKLRLTKNHIQNITQTYCNEIIASSPGVGFSPANKSELQDLKASELNHDVWQDAKSRYRINDKVDSWCGDFVELGETHVKIFYDPDGGETIAHEQKLDDEGNGLFDEQGNALPDEDLPVLSGKFVFEQIHGFNLLRPPEAKELEEAEYLIVRKMVDTEILLKQFPENKEFVEATRDDTFKVFDPGKGGFRDSLKETMLKEYYFRPSRIYPKGRFYITTRVGILASGELPGGIFPIKSRVYNKTQTLPRGKSPIKDMRPYQIEINRSASKMAEHQITLGDDKILVQHGTKTSAGASLPGVRTINFTGMEPKIMPGRDGSQYLAYMQSQIEELYFVMGVEEYKKDKSQAKVDAFALLFQAAKRKKKFQRPISRFEEFLIDIADTYLRLAKIHMPDGMLIRATGREEFVNLEEFRNLDDFSSQIIIEAQSDDVETKLGKQLSLSQTLQFGAGQLEKQDVGRLVRAMPFVDADEIFDDITMDYDTANNVILALDRGEKPPINEFDPHPYMIKRLSSRMQKADFRHMGPEVQGLYQIRIELHMAMEAQNQLKIQSMKDTLIPTGGYLVTMDFYVQDTKNPGKTKRVRLPYESVLWLIQRLETQGQGLDQLENLNEGALAQLSEQIVQKQRGGVIADTGSLPNAPGAVTPQIGQDNARASITPNRGPLQ